MQWTNGAYKESCKFLGIPFVTHADSHRITNQLSLSSMIKCHCLTFFRHLARMDETTHGSQAVFEPPPENCRRPPGWLRTTCMMKIHNDLCSQPVCRVMSLHSATHLQWCTLLLDWISCCNPVYTTAYKFFPIHSYTF